MNKFSIIASLFLFVFVNITFSQKLKLKKGENYYNVYSYNESIEKYEGITNKTTEIKRRLAESYYNIGKYKKSEEYYTQLVSSEDVIPEDYYHYAAVLAVNKKYEESEIWMKNYNELNKTDSRAVAWVNNNGFYKKIQNDKGRFKIESLNINTKNEDFGTIYYKNRIVFTSSNLDFKIIKKEWNWNELPFLDLFIADIDSNLQLINIRKFDKELNKKYHEGPASFSNSGNFMAYTRNNYTGKSKDDIIKLQIFTSIYKKGAWQTPISFPYNSDEYSIGHPALTEDGKTMYFASDMPGGIGGVDIYVTHRNETGKWSEPENLGSKINTEGNEMFPFVHKDGLLFFASDGLLGLGGLDIFIAQIKEGKIGQVENIGVPVNSSYDDFAFVLDSAQTSGYFSSNRLEGKGDDDIYLFRLIKPFKFGKMISGIAKDTKGNILSKVEVNLYDDHGNVIGTIKTKKDGKYEFIADQDKNYSLDGSKIDFTDGKNTADTYTEDYIINADLVLDKIPEFSLYCVIKDEKTLKAIEGVKITLINFMEHKQEKIITPKSGDFFRVLKNKQLNDSISYELKLEKEGYLTKTFNYNQKLYREGQYDISELLGIKMDKIEVGMDLGKIININPIYFDLDKSNIRPDAAIELDKIVKIMNENPDMEIELGSHTDCRGSKSYNLTLSDKRAKSSAQYIKERISNPWRLYGKGYGESKLVNKCKCKGTKRVPCTEEEHQQNRRTEFRIIKT